MDSRDDMVESSALEEVVGSKATYRAEPQPVRRGSSSKSLKKQGSSRRNLSVPTAVRMDSDIPVAQPVRSSTGLCQALPMAVIQVRLTPWFSSSRSAPRARCNGCRSKKMPLRGSVGLIRVFAVCHDMS